MHRPIWLALAILLPSNVLAQSVVGRDETTFTVAHRLSAGDWVRIASPNGTIRVVQASGSEVTIRAEKDVRRGSVEDVGFVVRRGGGITVCAVYDDADECGENGGYRGRNRGRRWSENRQIRINFTVSLPADARIKAGSGNGDITIEGGNAQVIATTGNGEIDISGTRGEVDANTGNGRVTVNGAAGPVDVSTGNGDIRISTASGPVDANTGNGSIDVSMNRVAGSPDMSFTTGNGRITVRVPQGYGAELDSSTGSGRVTVDLPFEVRGRMRKSHVRGRIGEGGGRLVLRSGNGNLNVVRS